MRGLFGGPAIGGLIGATGSAMAQPAPQPSQGMFGGGKRKVNWGGVIADALAGAAGMPGQYLASIQAQDQAAQRAKLAEAERAAGMQDWRARFDYEQAHKPADIPPILRDAQAWTQMTPEQRAAYQQMQEARSGPITVSLPGDRIYSGPRSGLADALRGGGVGGMQPGHIEDGYRFKGGNPGDPSAWEPVSGGPTQPASGTFRPAVRGPVTFDQFFDAIIKQESGGRFGVANYEGSGARGIGQIMPETERALARRLGIPYQPNLMTGTSPAAQQYQLAIAREAVKEAWQAGGNGKDPVTAAMYYHGGSNRRIWGPRTRRYGGDILRRLGGK